MAGMTTLTKDKFIPFLDINKSVEYVDCDWKRIDYSTIFELSVNEEEEDNDYICFAAPVTDVKNNKPELPQEIIIAEGNPIYDFVFNEIYNLPTGEQCKVPFLQCFGGSGRKAWRCVATLTGKVLNTVDGKISFSIKLGGEIEKGTYKITDGKPIFIPNLPRYNVTFAPSEYGAMYQDETGVTPINSVRVYEGTTVEQTENCLTFTEPDETVTKVYAIANEDYNFDGFDGLISPVTKDFTITPKFSSGLLTVTFAPSTLGAVYDAVSGGNLVESIQVKPNTELVTYVVAGYGVMEFTNPLGEITRYYAIAHTDNYFVKFGDFVTPITENETITPVFGSDYITVTFTNTDAGGFYDSKESGASLITSLNIPYNSDVIPSYEEGIGVITFVSPGEEDTTVYCIPAEDNYYLNPGTIPTKVTSAFTVTPEFTNETVTITFATSEDGAMYDEIEAGLVVTEATVIKGSEITDMTHAGIGIIKFNAAGIEQKFYAIANEGKSWSDFEDYMTPATDDATITPVFSSAAPMPPTPPEIKDNLDKYTMAELSQLSNYLEYVNEWTPETLETDAQYVNIKNLMESGSIWFSNSNGEQTATFEDMSSFDETKCNADYKCHFVYQDAELEDYKQFLNLRVIGILHDYNEDGKKIGLTLQTIRSFPVTQSYGSNQGDTQLNWGNSSLYASRWGTNTGTKLAEIADGIKSVIKPCVKAYQAARTTAANIEYNTSLIFAPAYGEMVANNPKISKYPWMNNNGTDFKPTSCEGYTYEYFQKIGTAGSGSQEALAKLSKDNKDVAPKGAVKKGASLWLRTVDDSSVKSISVISNEGDPYAFVDKSEAGMLLTFCV